MKTWQQYKGTGSKPEMAKGIVCCTKMCLKYRARFLSFLVAKVVM